MTPLMAWSWAIDGWIIAAGMIASMAAALLGNFLVLRRMSMLGDAISHAILPGLAAAYLLTGERSSLPMFLGAVGVGLLTAIFTQWIHRHGEVDEGASLGVVFTSLFALGLVMIVRAADQVDLDPGCVLYGAIELTPLDTWNVLGWRVPRVVIILSAVLVINAAYVGIFLKELRLTAFAPGLADTLGFPSWLMHYSLMTLVAVTAVASFEAVGNILVVAMLTAPAAAARLLSDRLTTMIGISVLLAALAAATGHVAAVVVPGWFGYGSTTTAGMMAVSAGLLFTITLFFAPRHGFVIKAIRRARLSFRILGEDVLGGLYRAGEASQVAQLSTVVLRDRLAVGRLRLGVVLWAMQRRRFLEQQGELVLLTERGAALARTLVRSHRLWEHYLVERAGVPADRIHGKAERLEHVTDRTMRDQLDLETSTSATDPHGQEIPQESPDDQAPESVGS